MSCTKIRKQLSSNRTKDQDFFFLDFGVHMNVMCIQFPIFLKTKVSTEFCSKKSIIKYQKINIEISVVKRLNTQTPITPLRKKIYKFT